MFIGSFGGKKEERQMNLIHKKEMPCMVQSIEQYKKKDKAHLSFRKGQQITVEKVNEDRSLYFGFHSKGKKEGWFPVEYVSVLKGVEVEERRKSKVEARKEKKEREKKEEEKKVEIPILIQDCIGYLREEERLSLEGIFRISGSMSEINVLKECYAKQAKAGKKGSKSARKVVLSSYTSDPHVVAGLLKMYFRELPVPLLTYELYDCWVAAIGAPDENSKVLCVGKVIALLPQLNKMILMELLSLLVEIANRSAVNLMNVSNLSIIFSPTLMRPPGDEIQLVLADSTYSNQLFALLISHYDTLFLDAPFQSSVSPAHEGFNRTLRRGHLLMAKGNIAEGEEEGEEEDVMVDLMTIEEMVSFILEGRVDIVEQHLSKLDPDVGADRKQQLLQRIDEMIEEEDEVEGLGSKP